MSASQPAHARAFLAQLASVVPPGYSLEVEDDVLYLIHPSGARSGSGAYWLITDVLLREEALVGAVGSLRHVQQEIAEETTEPWPARSGPGYRGFPEPEAVLVGRELHLWFGDRQAPALELAPIDLGPTLLDD